MARSHSIYHRNVDNSVKKEERKYMVTLSSQISLRISPNEIVSYFACFSSLSYLSLEATTSKSKMRHE